MPNEKEIEEMENDEEEKSARIWSCNIIFHLPWLLLEWILSDLNVSKWNMVAKKTNSNTERRKISRKKRKSKHSHTEQKIETNQTRDKTELKIEFV